MEPAGPAASNVGSPRSSVVPAAGLLANNFTRQKPLHSPDRLWKRRQILLSLKSILVNQAVDPGELALVVGDATMMLVQTCASPTSRTRSDIQPCGWRTRSETTLVSSR